MIFVFLQHPFEQITTWGGLGDRRLCSTPGRTDPFCLGQPRETGFGCRHGINPTTLGCPRPQNQAGSKEGYKPDPAVSANSHTPSFAYPKPIIQASGFEALHGPGLAAEPRGPRDKRPGRQNARGCTASGPVQKPQKALLGPNSFFLNWFVSYKDLDLREICGRNALLLQPFGQNLLPRASDLAQGASRRETRQSSN